MIIINNKIHILKNKMLPSDHIIIYKNAEDMISMSWTVVTALYIIHEIIIIIFFQMSTKPKAHGYTVGE